MGLLKNVTLTIGFWDQCAVEKDSQSADLHPSLTRFRKTRIMSAKATAVKLCIKILMKNALNSSEVTEEVKAIAVDSWCFKLHETSVLYVPFLRAGNRILFSERNFSAIELTR